VSVVSEAIAAIKEALKLADEVKRTGETVKEIAHEMRDHDRRLTRLEAKWEAAVELSAARSAPRRIQE
jgi:hypothetical protein